MFKTTVASILLSFFILSSAVGAESDTTMKSADTLSFKIVKINIDSSLSDNVASIKKTSIKPILQYDFKNQYPWYQTAQKTWDIKESYQLKFTQLPTKGWIYFFSVDGENNAREHGFIALDSLSKTPFVYPDSTKGFAFTAEGADHLVLWYSRDSVSHVKQLIQGIEMTMGSFIKRNNRQINNDLVLPIDGWHLLENDFGFATNKDLFAFSDHNILPIVIRFDVKKEDAAKKKATPRKPK
jgi:hypothetical protein